MSGWDTDAKMIAHFPSFIEGPAFLVFSKMAEGDKKKKEKAQELILTSFSLSKSDAYRAFQQRMLRVDETPDECVADLRRLLALAEYATPNDDKDTIVVEQLLSAWFAEKLRQGALPELCWEGENCLCLLGARACIAGRRWRLSCWPGHDRCCCCLWWW